MSAHARTLPGLLHGSHVGQIRLRFDLRRKRLEPRGLDDEVRAARHNGIGSPAPADAPCKPPVVRSSTELAYALDQSITFSDRIERQRRPHLERELAAVLDRI